MTSDLFDQGLQVRHEALGADGVDHAIHYADDFNRPMQELVTESC